MKNEIKVTVIIPVYNKENLLKRCLDSIEAQSYPYFEVVVVDDGSKDNSGEICDSYREKTVAFVCIIMRIKGLVHLEILELNKQKVSILPL